MHSHEPVPGYQFDLSGGVLCLDFANTVSRRKPPQYTTDHVNSYDDLVAFAEQSKLVSPERADELRLQARRHSREARTALRRAFSYRESLYRAFSAVAQGKAASPHDLEEITDIACQALANRRLARTEDGYRWEWEGYTRNKLDRILWLIAQSATELLTSSQLSTVRMCEAPDCAWLFLDQSRNRSRRWCDMKVCGNRQKARRHYQRTRG